MSYIGANGIGKIFLGNTQIAKAYLGGTLVYQYGSGPTPPPVVGKAYIRGGADGSYIDTGITADNTVRVIVWARNWNPTSGALFGSRVALSQDTFAIGTHSAQNTGRIRLDFAQSNTTYADNQFSNLSHYHKYEYYNGELKVDDVTVATATSGTFSNQYNIHLFGLNNAGTHANPGLPIDICACKIYKNGTLVRDFTAVNAPSVGLLDAVSGTVFTNAGSGSFTYGSFNENAYTPLLYVACDGQQYFDTGLYGSESTKVVTKFRPTSTTKTYYQLFGTRNRTEGNTLMLELMLGNESYANRYFYARYKAGSNTVYNSASQTNNDLVYVHNANVFTLYKNNSQLGTKTATASSFTTTYTMYVGSSNMSGSWNVYPWKGYIYYIGFGANKNFVPASVNNVAGMYDTYNDVFYPSASGTAFIAGTTL